MEGVFLPKLQRLDRSHRKMKAAFILAAVVTAGWVLHGRALWRRYVVGLETVRESERKGEGFLALAFPRITKKGDRFTMTREDLGKLLDELRSRGFVSIGLADLEAFYDKGRPLPSKAVLLAFDRDDSGTVSWADEAIERRRQRALLFIDKTSQPEDARYRRAELAPHVLRQLRKGGAWDLGWVSDDPPRWKKGEPLTPAVLDSGDPKHSWTRNAFRFPVRFVASRDAFNDAQRLKSNLNILRLRGGKPVEELAASILAAWPRRAAFVDDFAEDGLGRDWISERGVVVAVGRRMVLVPTPKQKSASVYLSGTDTWRDAVAEMTLSKYRRQAWLQLRSASGRWVRVGMMNGYWYLQQKTGPGDKPVTIARAPVTMPTSLPARVRLVVKGDWAIVHVNGRMQFGKAVRVHPGVDAGRVELDTYSDQNAAALGVVTSFAAAPLGRRWLYVAGEPAAGDPAVQQRRLDGLREKAVFASVLSPRWLDVQADGTLAAVEEDRELMRSLAGYYRCRLVPLIDFAAPHARIPPDREAALRMADLIVESLRGSEAAGVNIRLDGRRADAKSAAAFLGALREKMHEQKRRLWVTTEAEREPWMKEADGVLRPLEPFAPGASMLETIGPPGPGSV